MTKTICTITAFALLICQVPGCDGLDGLSGSSLDTETPDGGSSSEDTWGAGCVFPDSDELDARIKQYNFSHLFANPIVVAGLVTAAVAVPVAVHDDDDRSPVEEFDDYDDGDTDTGTDGSTTDTGGDASTDGFGDESGDGGDGGEDGDGGEGGGSEDTGIDDASTDGFADEGGDGGDDGEVDDGGDEGGDDTETDGEDDIGDDDTRLSANDVLRAACLDTCYLTSDEEIELLLFIIETNRLLGWCHTDIDLCSIALDLGLYPRRKPHTTDDEDGELDEYATDWSQPDGLSLYEACEQCLDALLDQVYELSEP